MTLDNGNGFELPPPQHYKYSIKLETTARGIRLHIHCYGNSSSELRKETLSLYCDMENDLREHKLPLAPIEVKA